MSVEEKKIVTGISDLKVLLTTSKIYVDRTLFIKEWWYDNGDGATLLTRIRRWGKSVVLDTVDKFFALEVDENGKQVEVNSNRVLFEGGNVTIRSSNTGLKKEVVVQKSELALLEEGKYLAPQGKYPLIRLDFQNIEANSYEEIESLFREEMQRVYMQFKYLSDSPSLNEEERDRFKKHKKGEFTYVELKSSLKFLTQLLKAHHDTKVIVLVDEYDKPVNSLLTPNYLLNPNMSSDDKELKRKVVGLVTSILASCGKGNPFLERMLMVGIFDTLKKTGNSGFNNVAVYDMSDSKYSRHFGFTEEQIKNLVSSLTTNASVLDEATKKMRSWYNGYYTRVFGESEPLRVYNPWSVVRYLVSSYGEGNFVPEEKPKSYWVNSGASDMLHKVMASNSFTEIWSKFRDLLSSDMVEFDFNPLTCLAEDGLTVERLVSYILVNSGYLSAKLRGQTYYLSIPNNEIREEFRNVITTNLQTANNDKNRIEILYMLLGNVDARHIAKAFDAIWGNNAKDLTAIFAAHNSLKCIDARYSINFLEAAALSGSKEVFDVVDKHCTGVTGKSSKFALIDYAELSGSREMVHEVRMLPGGEIKKPNLVEDMTCYKIHGIGLGLMSIIGGSIIGLGMFGLSLTLQRYLGKPGEGDNWKKNAGLSVVTSIVAGFLIELAESLNTRYCENYINYHNIDTSIVSQITSMDQALKYHMEDRDVYAVVNKNCEKPIHNFSLPYFTKGTLLPNPSLNISLCEQLVSGGYRNATDDGDL